jgi:hypothetical protein
MKKSKNDDISEIEEMKKIEEASRRSVAKGERRRRYQAALRGAWRRGGGISKS